MSGRTRSAAALKLAIGLGICMAPVFVLAQPKALSIEQPVAQHCIPQITLRIDAAKVTGPLDTSFRVCVGAGRANEGLRADWQRQLSKVHQECGFQYIRMHGLLDDDMGVYMEDPQGHPIHNWQYIDELYDFLLRIHMKPFVELGFMPSALSSGKQTIFWYRANVTPPKDYGKWSDLIKDMVRHWTERYGEKEVSTWYFEVWNEPNLDGFWAADQGTYFRLYKTTAEAIKSVSNTYKVGGPATAAGAWIPEFIRWCTSNQAPVDFISTHAYGVDAGFLDEYGNRGTVISKNPDAVSGDMIRTRSQILASPLPHLDLHYTEWSASYTPADPIHDNYQEAAYILDKVKKGGQAVQSLSYWTFTDIFEESGPRSTPFHGGFGLLNYQDIPKAAYFAFRYLNQLGDSVLETDGMAPSIVTKAKDGSIRALFWDFTIAHLEDSVNDQVYYKRDLPARNKDVVHVEVAHLSPGKYKLNVYAVGYRVNDAYATYMDLGSPAQLSPAQVATIKEKNSGAPVYTGSVTIGSDGLFRRDFPRRENDVFLLELQKAE